MDPRKPRPDFEGLYRSHHDEVYRAALRKLGDHHEAEDVTQAAFLDAYRAVLRGPKPDYRGRGSWQSPRMSGAAVSEQRSVGRARRRSAMRVGRPPSRRGAPRPRRSGLRWRRWPRTSGRCSCCASSAGSRTARSPRSSTCPSRPSRCCFSAPARSCAQNSGPGRLASAVHPYPALAPRSRRPISRWVRRSACGGNRRRGCHRHEHRRRVGRIGCRAEAATGRACATRSLEAGASSSCGTCCQRRANSVRQTVGAAIVVKRQVKGVPPTPCRGRAAGAGASGRRSRRGRRRGARRPCRTECDPGDRRRSSAPALVPAVPSVSQAPIVPVVTTHLPPLPSRRSTLSCRRFQICRSCSRRCLLRFRAAPRSRSPRSRASKSAREHEVPAPDMR